jgi:hypothetical protein
VNQGQGVLSETGLISGTAMDENGLPNGSMGICLFDFDLDLREDLWVCNYQNETFGLYQNLGSANFASISVAAGIHALERLYVAFGAASADLDLDGDGDIVVANGHVMYHPKDSTGPQPALALVNNGRGRLEKAAFPPASYFSQGHWGRGVLASDLDYDGDIDLVFSNSNEPSAILRNETKSAGKLLTLRLIGTACNRDAIGAFVILHTSARDQIRTLCGGGSYLSSGDHLLYWGVPEGATVQGLTVHWPDGQVQKVDTVTGPGIHTVAQASK